MLPPYSKRSPLRLQPNQQAARLLTLTVLALERAGELDHLVSQRRSGKGGVFADGAMTAC
jgi:hypothetical protein